MGRLSRAARESEVREHRASVLMYEDVRRLEVAMHDARVMRVLQTITDLAQIPPRSQRVERSAVQDVAQRAAADQGHGQERSPVDDFEVIDGKDVGMVEFGQGLGLGLESLDEAVVLK